MFTDSDTIQTDGLKGQLCFRSVEPPVLKMRVTCVELFSELSALGNIAFNVAEKHDFCRFRKILNPAWNGGNSRVYYVSNFKPTKKEN